MDHSNVAELKDDYGKNKPLSNSNLNCITLNPEPKDDIYQPENGDILQNQWNDVGPCTNKETAEGSVIIGDVGHLCLKDSAVLAQSGNTNQNTGKDSDKREIKNGSAEVPVSDDSESDEIIVHSTELEAKEPHDNAVQAALSSPTDHDQHLKTTHSGGAASQNVVPAIRNSSILKMTRSEWHSIECDDTPNIDEHNPGPDTDDSIWNEDDKVDEEEGVNSESSCDSFMKTEDVITDQLKPVSFFKIFQFADCLDYVIMLVGLIGAIGMGSLIPINFIIYGRVIDLMIDTAILKDYNGTQLPVAPVNETYLFSEIQSNVKWFCVIGGTVIGLAFLEMSLWMWTSERQTRRMRQAAFWALLNKHQGWLDKLHVGELASRLNDDIFVIQMGLGDKFAKTLEWTATFFAGYIIGFIRGWRLTLVILAVLPILGIVVALFTKVVRKLTQAESESYAKAGAIAEEVFAAIRTVVAFGGEEKEIARYSSNLESACVVGVRKGLLSGVMQGLIWLIIFCCFGLAFWYGSKLVADGEYTGGQVLQIFLGLLIGTTSVGHAVPYLETLSAARGAAAKVFDIIDHKSEIDGSSSKGLCLTKVEGTIQFHNVIFSYPTHKSVTVLNGASFTVTAGQTVAIIGPSGCGKSTVIQLIQRFYDPDDGKITLDGVDLRELNLRWLRNQVGVVSQEPLLFSGTILENIRMGNLTVTQSELEKAAKQANIHDFIMSLPKNYGTMIGESGAQLSGGQKQRIAIARALVRNPKILLLDEATSALDTQSESVVQQALDKVSHGRTTLVIAHRLATIKNSDVIIGLEAGRVIEQGNHHELLSQRGVYHGLIKTQRTLSRELSIDSLDQQDFILNEVPLADKRARLKRQRTINQMDSVTLGTQHVDYGPGSSAVNYYRSMSVLSTVENVEDKLPTPSIRRILRLNASQSSKMIIGCFGAMLMGASTPIFSVVLSDVLGNFATSDRSTLMKDAVFLAGMFVVIGVVSAFGVWTQNYFFALSGTNLTMKIRKMVFAATLKQELGWFDKPENQVGALTSRLSYDAAQIQGAAGQQFGMLIQAIANMGTAIIIAFIYGPKLAGVIFVFIPLMFATGIIQGKMVQDNTRGSLQDLDEAAQVASEAIGNIRTVAALTRERYFQQKYEKKLQTMYIKAKKNSFVFGVFYAISQSIIFFAYAATFSYGGFLIERHEMEFHIVFRVFACLIFGSMSLGRALSWMPDYNKAKIAAAKIFNILDREPERRRGHTEDMIPEACHGRVDLKDVIFSYPTRPDVPVLHGLSLSVLPGQTVALVGTSGCGKSTVINLLERFYDPTAGYMAIDSDDLSCLSLPWLRSQMALVSQEPVLFDLTIRENIAYGANSRDVPMSDIIAAAKLANIHVFIENLPLGYETTVGSKGAQLSGGQKQRVAIARALLRKPKILLLDEATSALDNESEKVVQEALNKAREGRTTIIIAHRLSTIKDADAIVVIHSGRVVEEGTHKLLMERRGFYYGLHRAQRCRKHCWRRQMKDMLE